MVPQLVQQSEWIISAVLLFVVAWARFNSPPTNRSGTTFALFFFGVIFYYALILPLWILVIIMVSRGSIGFDNILQSLGQRDPKAQQELAQYAPIVAALIIVVASQFRQVYRIDTAARAFCVKLAAIPREADRLAIELAQSTDFQPKTEHLRSQVVKLIAGNIGRQALNFSNDGELSARFTRAVALYCLFVGPRNNGTAIGFSAKAYSRSAYARIMQLGEAMVARADARYKDLMNTGLAYFTSPHPTSELKEALNCNIFEVSNLICSLIARYVLYCERTSNGRLQRLSDMGFDAHPTPTFGLDQWATTIILVILVGFGMMALMPGARPIAELGAGRVLIIAITYGVSIGFAVLGAIVVAQRFIARHDGERSAFPPIAELTIAALIVAGLSVGLRIAIPLIPALIYDTGVQDVLAQFAERLPGIITPFVCTISLGLLCSYLGSLNWSWYRVAAVGALGNGLAFMAAGGIVGSLLDPKVLTQFYVHPEEAIQIIAMSSGLTGFMIGAMVLSVFNKSERVRKDAAERGADGLHAGIPEIYAPPLAEDLEAPALPARSQAAQNLGGYERSDVEALEGRYVCFRPALSSTGVINAYLIVVRWDEATSCLVFEEQDRVDAGHTQRGRVFIPDGRPLMSFVTVESGAMRLIMVSRPKDKESARGLIMTLSNPDGVHFTPASAPIVLKRLVPGKKLQLGFIQPGAPDYDGYRRELDTVIPAFGFFATAPRQASGIETVVPKSAEDIRLSIVR